ncbi:MAG: polymer-forming cytoskeletal protein [Candidatus Aminicenantes bacterium]|jgi:Integral membrane protein CcmA involved in cell shape determination|nr:polymer-forming cytoskeletal protein [Candidatus Aminicenantes bacterium]
MSPDEKKQPGEANLTRPSSRLGQQLVMNGTISGPEDLELQGNFTGKIDLAFHDLSIQKTAKVKAEIKAKNVFIHGEMDGQLKAERVVISESGRFTGELLACKVSIQNGAKFKGTIKISKEYQP